MKIKVSEVFYSLQGAGRFVGVPSLGTSKLNVNYSSVDLNKAEQDVWIMFPWGDWRK